jgi:hypothetical protein
MEFITGLIPGLSFGAPLMLWALAGLPVIYWLLRVTPPAPKRIVFPPLRLLLGLRSPEETPARTPLWLLLMRLATAAVAIIALAEPIYDTTPATAGNGPLVLVVDNDWPAAQQWPARVEAMRSALTGAARGNRQVTIIATAELNPLSPQWMDPRRAASTADEMVPQPWLADRRKALEALAQLRPPARPEIIWLSSGVDTPGAREFADALANLGNLSVYGDDANTTALALRPPDNNATGFGVTLTRIPSEATREGRVAALDNRGRILDTAAFRFGSGEAEATTAIPLPLELRNDTSRIIVQGAESAGTVQLVDSRYRRRPVGVVASNTGSAAAPLISDIYYIERALGPYAEVRKGTLDQLVDSGIAVLALADIGQLTATEREKVNKFVEAGGMLLRFAGPRLAAANANDDLLPVRLRQGERLMGSALAWAEAQHLAVFPQEGPFRGLPVPEEVTVGRQVLAEPSIELAEHTWARLTDGTPLVTADAKGRGWVVLFHVPASPGWSTLPLSGLYVDMLRRTIALSGGVAGAAAQRAGNLPPYQNLNGFGELVQPFPEAIAIRGEDFEVTTVGPQHPPGLYGNEGAVVALNAVTARTDFEPLNAGRALFGYASGGVMRILKWPLLQIVMLVLLVDALISLTLRGFVPLGGIRRLARRGAAVAAFFALLALPTDLWAQPAEENNMVAALDTRLAYVITGAPDVDQMSRAGLWGLGLHLRARTAYEPENPVGVDIERDDLSFFPLLYWPMAPSQRDLSDQAVAKLDDFMRRGGTILFDTRDAGLGNGTGASTGNVTLQRLLAKLDIPPLQPLPAEHVLSKTFYILKEFPGRWIGGQVWIESIPAPRPGEQAQTPARGGDGVSPIIIGGNDWAAAWALDDELMPLAAVVPGGDQQREFAIRFGVNVVIYALTGNYKTDQVHVNDLLRRLGQ